MNPVPIKDRLDRICNGDVLLFDRDCINDFLGVVTSVNAETFKPLVDPRQIKYTLFSTKLKGIKQQAFNNKTLDFKALNHCYVLVSDVGEHINLYRPFNIILAENNFLTGYNLQ